MSYDQYMPGATAVGIAYKDGVVLGAERRITLGNFVRSKSGKKVFRVTDTVGAVCAGWWQPCRTWSGRLASIPS